jgi:hypothetical protein
MSRVLFSIGIVQVLVILVNLARSKILSLLLGPAGFGVVSTIDQVVLTTVNLAAGSFPFTALKVMARSHSEGEEPFRRTFAASCEYLGRWPSAPLRSYPWSWCFIRVCSAPIWRPKAGGRVGRVVGDAHLIRTVR